MTLEYYEYEEWGRVQSRFVDCPLCGHDFEDREPRWRHFFEEHTPEDAGLEPLGTISGDEDSSLWGDLDEFVEEEANQSAAVSGSGSGR